MATRHPDEIHKQALEAANKFMALRLKNEKEMADLKAEYEAAVKEHGNFSEVTSKMQQGITKYFNTVVKPDISKGIQDVSVSNIKIKVGDTDTIKAAGKSASNEISMMTRVDPFAWGIMSFDISYPDKEAWKAKEPLQQRYFWTQDYDRTYRDKFVTLISKETGVSNPSVNATCWVKGKKCYIYVVTGLSQAEKKKLFKHKSWSTINRALDRSYR